MVSEIGSYELDHSNINLLSVPSSHEFHFVPMSPILPGHAGMVRVIEPLKLSSSSGVDKITLNFLRIRIFILRLFCPKFASSLLTRVFYQMIGK